MFYWSHERNQSPSNPPEPPRTSRSIFCRHTNNSWTVHHHKMRCMGTGSEKCNMYRLWKLARLHVWFRPGGKKQVKYKPNKVIKLQKTNKSNKIHKTNTQSTSINSIKQLEQVKHTCQIIARKHKLKKSTVKNISKKSNHLHKKTQIKIKINSKSKMSNLETIFN